MAWSDNYNVIYNNKLAVDDKKYWNFNIEEHKKRGTLNMNIRQFAKAPEGYDASEHGGKSAYEGPTKNGMLVQVESLQQVEELQKAFNSYFEEVKKYLEED